MIAGVSLHKTAAVFALVAGCGTPFAAGVAELEAGEASWTSPEGSSPADAALEPADELDAGSVGFEPSGDVHEASPACELGDCHCGSHVALCCVGACPSGFEGMTCYCGDCRFPSVYQADAGACR